MKEMRKEERRRDFNERRMQGWTTLGRKKDEKLEGEGKARMKVTESAGEVRGRGRGIRKDSAEERGVY